MGRGRCYQVQYREYVINARNDGSMTIQGFAAVYSNFYDSSGELVYKRNTDVSREGQSRSNKKSSGKR